MEFVKIGVNFINLVEYVMEFVEIMDIAEIYSNNMRPKN